MSKEYEFHKLIEQQNEDEKRAMWNKINLSSETAEEEVVSDGEVLIVANSLKLKSILVILSCSFLFIIVLFLGLFFGLKKKPLDNIRYCDRSEYYIFDTEVTIKQYGESNKLNILYFDIYEESLYYSDKQYRLNTTDEVICLNEELLDSTNAFITFYVTDNRTEIDLLKAISEICNQESYINETKINWGYDDNVAIAYAKFEYNDFNYFLSVEEAISDDYILELVEHLLS